MHIPWSLIGAGLSISTFSFLIYSLLMIRWSPKQITHQQALVIAILMYIKAKCCGFLLLFIYLFILLSVCESFAMVQLLLFLELQSSKIVLHCYRSCDLRLQFLTPIFFRSSTDTASCCNSLSIFVLILYRAESIHKVWRFSCNISQEARGTDMKIRRV
jgi:hypothetical protein